MDLGLGLGRYGLLADIEMALFGTRRAEYDEGDFRRVVLQ